MISMNRDCIIAVELFRESLDTFQVRQLLTMEFRFVPLSNFRHKTENTLSEASRIWVIIKRRPLFYPM
jgi:hypothetical protein